MSTENPTVRVGVGVFVSRSADGKFLIGRRMGSHGAKTWQLPGGHLEFGESWEQCGSREVMEEAGLAVKSTAFVTATNDIFAKEEKHYVTIFMKADCVDEDPKAELCEPHKCESWKWVSWGELRDGTSTEYRPLFKPLENLFTQYHDQPWNSLPT